MSKTLAQMEQALRERPEDTTSAKLVKALMRHGKTTRFGGVVTYGDLSKVQKYVVLSTCERFLAYQDYAGRRYSLSLRRDLAVEAMRKLFVHPSRNQMEYPLTDQTIEDGLAVFVDMLSTAANKLKLRCMADEVIDAVHAVRRAAAVVDGHHRQGRRGEHAPRALVGAGRR